MASLRATRAQTALGLVCARQRSMSLFCRGMCVSNAVRESTLQHCKSKSLSMEVRLSRLPGQTLWAMRHGPSGLTKSIVCGASDFGTLCEHALPFLMKLCRPDAVVCLLGKDVERSWETPCADHMLAIEDVAGAWERSGLRSPVPRLEWRDVRPAYMKTVKPKLTLVSRDDRSLRGLCAAPAWITDSGMVDRVSFVINDAGLDADAWQACPWRHHMRALCMDIQDTNPSWEDLARILKAAPAELTELHITIDHDHEDDDEDHARMPAMVRALQEVRMPGLKRLAWNVHNRDDEGSWAYALPDWAVDQIEVLSLRGNAQLPLAFRRNVASCPRLHTLEVHPDSDMNSAPWTTLLINMARGDAGKALEVLVIGAEGTSDGAEVLNDLVDFLEHEDAFPALKHIVATDAVEAWRMEYNGEEEEDALDMRLRAFLRKHPERGILLNRWTG